MNNIGAAQYTVDEISALLNILKEEVLQAIGDSGSSGIIKSIQRKVLTSTEVKEFSIEKDINPVDPSKTVVLVSGFFYRVTNNAISELFICEYVLSENKLTISGKNSSSSYVGRSFYDIIEFY